MRLGIGHHDPHCLRGALLSMALACALNTLAAPARWPILELAVWPGFRARGRLAGTWDAMTTTKPIRVLIADDHAMVRSGLAAFLMASDDLELVGEASNGLEAVRVCAETRPDVVLMDLVMPGMDGPTAIRAIHDAYPEIHVIALTSFPEEDLVERALGAGAISYLLKSVGADELAGATRGANAG